MDLTLCCTCLCSHCCSTRRKSGLHFGSSSSGGCCSTHGPKAGTVTRSCSRSRRRHHLPSGAGALDLVVAQHW
jgi:hypothetical protein